MKFYWSLTPPSQAASVGEEPADCPPAFMTPLSWHRSVGTETLAGLLWVVTQWFWGVLGTGAGQHCPLGLCVPSPQTTKLDTEHRLATYPASVSRTPESTVPSGHWRDLQGALLPEPPLEARNRLRRESCHLSLKGVGCLPAGRCLAHADFWESCSQLFPHLTPTDSEVLESGGWASVGPAPQVPCVPRRWPFLCCPQGSLGSRSTSGCCPGVHLNPM